LWLGGPWNGVVAAAVEGDWHDWDDWDGRAGTKRRRRDQGTTAGEGGGKGVAGTKMIATEQKQKL